MNKEQVEKTKSLLGEDTVEMLLQVHQDSLWILENLGVGCKQTEIQDTFQKFAEDGQAVVYEDRIYITSALVEQCLKIVPRVSDFFVPLNGFFIGGTAPYV
ncbi:MAG: trimethylamine--corrinoid methyltransferase, partial [Deltaproteobacteria bacterium]|nr:trimethylamine--corrinoid methyltransferase [Deltaproteobacteria bacterium]